MEINDSLINIFITCFVTIFYISRKVLNRNKKSKYTEEIISKINDLDIGKFTIDNLLSEIKNILKPESIENKNIKINILSDNNINE
jgi:hypothetical protein